MTTDGAIAERVETAFRRNPPSETGRHALRALFEHPGLHPTNLSQICGWNPERWQETFDAMCTARVEDLAPALAVRPGGDGIWECRNLLIASDPDTGALTMRPAALRGLQRAGVL